MNTIDLSLTSPPCSQASRPIFSRLEREVIRLGIRDGELSVARSGRWGFLSLSGAPAKPLSNPKLETLRSWTELARGVLAHGCPLATDALADAGYSAAQIAEVQRHVAASVPSAL